MLPESKSEKVEQEADNELTNIHEPSMEADDTEGNFCHYTLNRESNDVSK